jgi:hypothetical protein
MAKKTYTIVTPTEHLEAIVEATGGLYEVAGEATALERFQTSTRGSPDYLRSL